jgi:hypothetical protein
MRIVLQGSLHHFGVRDLLAFVARSSQEGTFDAESDGNRVRIALRGGQVIGIESAGSSDAEDAVAKLLQWSDGSFTFLDDVVIPENAASLAADIEALIAEAEMRIAEARRLAELYPDDSVKFRVVNRPPGEISLTAEEFQLLFQIGTGKSLAQLKSDSGRAPADLYPIVKRLQMTGLIEPFGDSEATSRDAASPKAAPPAFATAVVSPVAAPEPAPATEKMATLSARTPPARETPPPPDEQPPTLIEPLTPVPATQAGLSTNQSVETPLVATLTADDGVMHPLLEESSTIGRTAANAIALRDPSVSAKHARIVRGAGGFTIEDLGSRNGTYVNSEKLSEKRLLADGDLVRLGKIILTFNLASNVKRSQSTERELMK